MVAGKKRARLVRPRMYVPIALFGLTSVCGGTVEIGRGVLAAARQTDGLVCPPPRRRAPYHSRQRLPVKPSLTAAAPRPPDQPTFSCAFSLRRTLRRRSHHPSHDSPPVQGRRHRTDDNIIIVVCSTTYVVSRHVFSRSSPPTT